MTHRFHAATSRMLALVTLFVAAPAVAAPVEIPCDEPSCPETPVVSLPPPTLVPVSRPRWQPKVSIAALSGVSAHGVLFGSSSGPVPYLGGELRVMWQRPPSRIGLGLRLAGSSTLTTRGEWSRWEGSYDRGGDLRVLGFDAGFVFSASWFWLSSGFGVMHVQDLRSPTCSSGSSACYGSDAAFTVPDVTLAVGLDIPLGSHLALRLYGQASTLIVSARLNAGGGLVVRF